VAGIDIEPTLTRNPATADASATAGVAATGMAALITINHIRLDREQLRAVHEHCTVPRSLERGVGEATRQVKILSSTRVFRFPVERYADKILPSIVVQKTMAGAS
jgi:hypothetical protein